jgi:membrane protein YqaA with SNARE-associated domain
VKYKIGKNSATTIAVTLIVISLVLATLIFVYAQNPFLLLFVSAFAFNLIPFAGPSNLLIASTAAIGMGNIDASTLVIIGVIIALGATVAKGIHYMVTFFVSEHLSQKRQERLNMDAKVIRRWAFPLLFLVAATPLPDEPIVIPLGLMKYSPVKFFSAYFLGKLTIAVAGAFIGQEANTLFAGWLSPDQMFIASIVVSIALTVIITYVLLKVDLNKLAEKYLHRKPKAQAEQERTNNKADNALRDETDAH